MVILLFALLTLSSALPSLSPSHEDNNPHEYSTDRDESVIRASQQLVNNRDSKNHYLLETFEKYLPYDRKAGVDHVVGPAPFKDDFAHTKITFPVSSMRKQHALFRYDTFGELSVADAPAAEQKKPRSATKVMSNWSHNDKQAVEKGSLEFSTIYPSGLIKGDFPTSRGRNPWYAESGLACFWDNDQATELAISVVERQSLVRMAPRKEMHAKRTLSKKSNAAKRKDSLMDRTYGNFETTVFDVRRDLITLLNDIKSGGLAPKFPRKQYYSMQMIVLEVSQRMKDAKKTLPEALGDFEDARGRLWDEGGTGTISGLVAAIRLKNGGYWDKRYTKPMMFEYD
jgi:hypothetical protein